MKFYVQKKDDIVIAYGCTSELPDGVTEITEDEYKTGIADLAEADAKAQAEREAKAKEELEARQKESAERQAKIDDYVAKVKAGTNKLEEVPEEYRKAVENIINPPKTKQEKQIDDLSEQVKATTEALNAIMMTMAQ